jgi:hypothetical protein
MECQVRLDGSLDHAGAQINSRGGGRGRGDEMSSFDRVYSGLKAVMMMNERFDRIDGQLSALGDDLELLSASHVDLAHRVATIEGYWRGRADEAARTASLSTNTRSE